MSLTLTPEADFLRKLFRGLQCPEDVADLLDVDYQHLIYYLYRMADSEKYASFRIPKKSGGFRQITAPISPLKLVQRKLNQVLQTVYVPKAAVHGFVPQRNIVSNAATHTNRQKKYILNLDLKDFFPSINFGRVRGMLMAEPYRLPAEVATVLAQICCFDNQLPQGAPTSPIVANMICQRLDSQLLQLARQHRAVYTRYADDITFSTSLPNFPKALAYLSGIETVVGDNLQQVIEDNGFTINTTKVRLQPKTHRQEVTGLVVNKVPNVRRKMIRQVRAMLHAWEKFGLEAAAREYFEKYNTRKLHRFATKPVSETQMFKEVVRGKIGFIGMVRGKKDAIYLKLLTGYEILAGIRRTPLLQSANVALNPIQNAGINEKLFISYSRKDEVFARRLTGALTQIGADVWLDTESILPGEPWDDAVLRGLQTSTIMLLILTPDSVKSDNVTDEWNKFKKDNKPIVPILLRQCDIPFRLDRIQYIDFREADGQDETFVVAFEGLNWRLKQLGLALKSYK